MVAHAHLDQAQATFWYFDTIPHTKDPDCLHEPTFIAETEPVLLNR